MFFCVLNVYKPREYPGLLRSYVNRKIDSIKKNVSKRACCWSLYAQWHVCGITACVKYQFLFHWEISVFYRHLQVNLCNQHLFFFWHPVTSDKYLWSQSISVNQTKIWEFRHPVQSNIFPWSLAVSDLAVSTVFVIKFYPYTMPYSPICNFLSYAFMSVSFSPKLSLSVVKPLPSVLLANLIELLFFPLK